MINIKLAICGIVVDLAHFNIHNLFITLLKSSAITGSGAGWSLVRFLACGIFIHLVLMAIIWPQSWGPAPWVERFYGAWNHVAAVVFLRDLQICFSHRFCTLISIRNSVFYASWFLCNIHKVINSYNSGNGMSLLDTVIPVRFIKKFKSDANSPKRYCISHMCCSCYHFESNIFSRQRNFLFSCNYLNFS